jgi:chloride channel protein, CIC family
LGAPAWANIKKRSVSGWTSFLSDGMARWLVLGLVVGAVTGLASAGFFYLLELAKHFSFHMLAGYSAPVPMGERLFEVTEKLILNRWVLFLLPIAGGLFGGFIVYCFAPEAEGHGTDAMIDAFHNKKGKIRGRVPLIKGIATIITLASGGSAGREGPIAQIGAGLGSLLAGVLKLSDRQRRILLLAGCGAGLAAIFRAPLGGALTAIEVLYREDLETEALIPTIISSITAYIIFTDLFGFQPIFFFPGYSFSDPRELFFYILLGLVCIPVGMFYVRFFHAAKACFFDRIPFPRYFKPALGGLGVALIGLVVPQVYGDGWGWLQLALIGKLGVTTMLVIAFCKIIATSCTISSGGSGGVFGPSLFIGGMLGGVVGYTGNYFFPEIVTQPGGFVIVGMAAFFAGVANAPLGTLLMCCEMTQGYSLIAPLMLVSVISILFNRDHSIYQSQVHSRMHSPAHIGDFTINILAEMKVRDVYTPEHIPPVSKTMPYGRLKSFFAASEKECFPVYDEQGHLCGCINWDHTRPIVYEQGLENLIIAGDIMAPASTVALTDNLHDALIKFIQTGQEELLVVDEQDSGVVLGVLRHDDIIHAYNREITVRKNLT